MMKRLSLLLLLGMSLSMAAWAQPLDPQGRPPERSAGHYALWHDADGWHLGAVPGDQERHFHGAIRVTEGRLIEVKALRPQGLRQDVDPFRCDPDQHSISFDFTTREGEGVDFRLAGEHPQLSFDLEVGDPQPRFQAERILVGQRGQHPSSNPFQLAGHPAASGGSVSLTWISGSSVKVQQLLGGKKGDQVDVDWQTLAPLKNKTYTRYWVQGTDLGYPFEHRGELVFLFGDTTGPVGTNLYYAGDTMATSRSTDPEQGVELNFVTRPKPAPLPAGPAQPRNPDGSYTILVRPRKAAGKPIDMGPFDVPTCGVSLDGTMYVVCVRGHPQDFSILTRYDETTKTFQAGRRISALPEGHFINGALLRHQENVLFYGTGRNRHSQIFLSRTPKAEFWSGRNATSYFTGLDAEGHPTWTQQEQAASPLVKDPASKPSIGNLKVVYEERLGLYLMTFDSFADSPRVYFSYASQPWGPWSTPQLIFDETRDKGLGHFLHFPGHDQPGTHLIGPTIGDANPQTTFGGLYSPYLIGRFCRVESDKLFIYYTLSTWNPYTVVLMRSEFTVGRP